MPSREMIHARALVAAAAVACASSCTTGNPRSIPAAPVRAEPARPPALEAAVASWHERDDIEPLAAYVAAHDGEELGVWREVVALARYESSSSDHDDSVMLGAVARDYPDTVAGSVAAITVQGDAIARVEAELPGMLAVDFLEGTGRWAADDTGRTVLGPQAREAIERARSPGLAARFADALIADGCVETMKYCTWWTARYPAAPQTEAVEQAAAAEWYRRGHPKWRGGDHARCALRCAKRCRAASTPLDDDCYAGCYAGC